MPGVTGRHGMPACAGMITGLEAGSFSLNRTQRLIPPCSHRARPSPFALRAPLPEGKDPGSPSQGQVAAQPTQRWGLRDASAENKTRSMPVAKFPHLAARSPGGRLLRIDRTRAHHRLGQHRRNARAEMRGSGIFVLGHQHAQVCDRKARCIAMAQRGRDPIRSMPLRPSSRPITSRRVRSSAASALSSPARSAASFSTSFGATVRIPIVRAIRTPSASASGEGGAPVVVPGGAAAIGSPAATAKSRRVVPIPPARAENVTDAARGQSVVGHQIPRYAQAWPLAL